MKKWIAVFLAAAFLPFAGTAALAVDPVTGLAKADPQPAVESLKP